MNEQTDLSNFYEHVQRAGQLRTEQHARRWTRATLRSLGLQLDRRTKRQLARALPEELADPLTRVFWLLHFRNKNLSSYAFQQQVARRSGNTDARFARLPISAVFGGLRQMIDQDVDRRVAETLSPELRELWQQAA